MLTTDLVELESELITDFNGCPVTNLLAYDLEREGLITRLVELDHSPRNQLQDLIQRDRLLSDHNGNRDFQIQYPVAVGGLIRFP